MIHYYYMRFGNSMLGQPSKPEKINPIIVLQKTGKYIYFNSMESRQNTALYENFNTKGDDALRGISDM